MAWLKICFVRVNDQWLRATLRVVCGGVVWQAFGWVFSVSRPDYLHTGAHADCSGPGYS